MHVSWTWTMVWRLQAEQRRVNGENWDNCNNRNNKTYFKNEIHGQNNKLNDYEETGKCKSSDLLQDRWPYLLNKSM